MERLPRPHGSTFLSLKFQHTRDELDRVNLLKHIVNLYTLDGFRWNRKPTSIPQLATILRIPQTDIMDYISNQGQIMGSLASPQNIKNTLESIITLSTSYAIQDRGLIQQQLEQLAISQDGKYKPFITAEVNKTLKLMLESNKNIMESYKTFFTTTNPITNILNLISNDTKEFLSPDQALEIITNKQLPASKPTTHQGSSPLSEHADLADLLHEEYGVGGLIDVRENRSGTEALEPNRAQEIEALQPNSLYTSLPAEHEEGHFQRRGIEVVDTDELP